MDPNPRVAQSSRPFQLAIGSLVRSSQRPLADARIDVPEIQESTRVSFSGGAVVAPPRDGRSAATMYRWVQSL